VWPGFFLTLFTRDPHVHAVGVPYLRVLALCLVLNGWEIVTAESVQGSGHTLVLSLIFSAFSLVRIPLAFWIPDLFHNGALGIAWVISITCGVRSLIIVAWASRGSWLGGLERELHGVSELPASEC
jgi:Na+-driven multidrug efflux pump